jgi:putative hemolysin
MDSSAPSFADPEYPLVKRALIRGIENLLGRRRLLPIYDAWQRERGDFSPTMWADLLRRIDLNLKIDADGDWAKSLPSTPLVVVANHPFGIADGVALLALAEQMKRPYRILLNAGFMRLPEMQRFGLPIDFSESEDALATNLKTRAEARRLLKAGVVILIFPGGGVATAEDPLGKAEELPWKLFAARLIQQTEAAVLPVHFDGQNSALFHFVSRYSLTLRLALLIRQFERMMGSTIGIRIGAPLMPAEIARIRNTQLLNDELYLRVHELGPGADGQTRTSMLPRPASARRLYPWDPPPRPDLNTALRPVSNS